MSEENQADIGATSDVAATAPQEPTSAEKYDGAAIRSERKDAKTETAGGNSAETRPGYNPVDVKTATPEAVQERIDYLYRQVKDKGNREREVNKILSEQARVIDELAKNQNAVVNHIQTKTLDDSEDVLTSAMNHAFEKGDHKGYLEAQRKLIKLGVDKELLKNRPQPQAHVPQPQHSGGKYNSASQIANDAAGEGYLSNDEARLTEAWQNERDETGNFVRPWARTADMNNPDQAFAAALRETQGVFSNPRYAALSYEDKLAEVDRRMGVAKRVANQSVSAGGLTGKGKTAKITLSADIEKMVRQTKWGGSKYKTDDDRLDAYRKQLATFRKGSR